MFVCIAKTEPDWDAFLQNAHKALGRSVTAGLDARHLPLAGCAAFVAAVSEFGRQGDALSAMRNDAQARRHAHYAFLVNVPRDNFFVLSSLGLTVTPADHGDFAVVSGKVSEWVNATVDGSKDVAVRQLCCSFVAFFERESLGTCWDSFEKDHQPDGFYVMVRK